MFNNCQVHFHHATLKTSPRNSEWTEKYSSNINHSYRIKCYLCFVHYQCCSQHDQYEISSINVYIRISSVPCFYSETKSWRYVQNEWSCTQFDSNLIFKKWDLTRSYNFICFKIQFILPSYAISTTKICKIKTYLKFTWKYDGKCAKENLSFLDDGEMDLKNDVALENIDVFLK